MDTASLALELPDQSLPEAGPEAALPAELRLMDAYWRAANYLSAGQIYLYDNPLLREPLTLAHVKPLVVGHWGTTPGQNFIYVHLNRVIKAYDLDMFYIAGPGHGGPALVANTYLEGSYSEIYPNISQDEDGLKKLFTQFSFPGGISSHVAPTTPGSIHEGGELGYSLSHAFGAAFDNPGLIVACIIGDGEAETGPLATSWHSNKLLSPVSDGAVLPILHLNGFKISNPTLLSRIEPDELEHFFEGCGWTPYFVEGDDPAAMHRLMADTLDHAIADIHQIQHDARITGVTTRPRWPLIVLRSPKGWTGPKMVDGLKVEGTFRAHQVPILVDAAHPGHVADLESWMRSYRAEELFDAQGRLIPELAQLAPVGTRRMGANPHTNGGALLRDLRMPDFRDHAVDVTAPGAVSAGDTTVLGRFLRDVARLNRDGHNFRIFGPDETLSNMIGAVFEVSGRQWDAATVEDDEFLTPIGQIHDSMLSEHQCQGWLEGYLLTGRHGLFNSYEAFIRIVDSMFSQHAKWLKVTKELPWRRDIASLNYLLASHVWQQDHNGFTHQDLREHLPALRMRVINVVDLMRLQPELEHPHGLSEIDYDALFTTDKPIIFGFHGYPWLVHRLTYRRTNRHLHVRGYKEEGTITTAFDMRVQNDLDRFHLVMDVIARVPGLGTKGAYLKQLMQDKLVQHKHYIDKHGEDLPEIRNWMWQST